MATSGSAQVNVDSTGYVKLRLSWQQLSQDIGANKTRIRLTLQVVTNQYGAMYGSAQKGWRIDCNGVTSGNWTIQTGANTTRTVGTRDVDITHNADGTKTFSASASATFDMSFNGWVGTKTVSVSGSLNTIPRASTPSVSGTKRLGGTMTINTNRASSGFTHTIKWAWAGKSGTIASNVGASCTWTPSISTFAPYLTDATSATCKITCDTYNGGTKIGTKTTSFTLSIPSSVVPTVSAVTVSETTDFKARFGSYISGKSKIGIKVTGAGSYGSVIKKFGKKYNANAEQTNTSGSFTDSPQAVGTIPIVGAVTDSRGRRATKSTSITVAAYDPPNLNGTSAIRYPDDESTTVRVTLKGSTTALNGQNTATVKVERRESGTSAWTQVNSANRGVSWSLTLDVTGLSAEKVWEIRVTATDAVGESVTTTLSVPTAHPVLDFRSNGRGLGIGSVATRDDAAEFGWQINANRGLGLHKVAGNESQAGWVRLASVSYTGNAHVVILTVYCGAGNNGGAFQNAWYRIFIKDGWQSSAAAEDAFGVAVETCNTGTSVKVKVLATSDHECEVWAYHPWSYTVCYLSIEASVGSVVTPAAYNPSVTTEPQGVEQIVDYRHIWDGTQTNDARQRFVDHVMLNNDIAITGATTDGSQTALLRMNTSNRVELGWTSGGLGGRVMKTIWTGTWSSGSITVSEAPYYNLFVLDFDNSNDNVVVARDESNIALRGACVRPYVSGAKDDSLMFNAIDIDIDGTKLTMAKHMMLSLYHKGNNNTTPVTYLQSGDPIQRIRGVV